MGRIGDARNWANKHFLFLVFLVPALELLAWGIAVSLPWTDSETIRMGLLQTAVTLGALLIAVPAGWAAWEAYRLAAARVSVHVQFKEPTGPPFSEPVFLMFESHGEVDARGFLIELQFSRRLSENDWISVWRGTAPELIVLDGELFGVAYLFTQPFSPHGPEVLAEFVPDQHAMLRPGGQPVFTVTWKVRGGNVIPASGTTSWSAER